MREAGYRSLEEVETWKKRDPIQSWKERLLNEKQVAPAELEAIDNEIATLVNEAVASAKAAPLPDAGTLMNHVYSE